jgi:hypothetical protein
MIMESTRMVALRPLLAELGWSDASTDTAERLTAHAGRLGLIVEPTKLIFVFIDPNTLDPVNLTITGGWSFGAVVALAHHLMIVDRMIKVG